MDFASTGSTPILDDAVTYSDIFVTNTQPIVSVNVGIVVQHPRISDLVFHLISPDGTRVLLMENRGGADTNGAGAIGRHHEHRQRFAATATARRTPISSMSARPPARSPSPIIFTRYRTR